MTVEVQDAKIDLLALAETAARGEEVLLVRQGEPLARLVSMNPPKRRLGGLEHLGIEIPDDFDEMGREEIEKMFYGE